MHSEPQERRPKREGPVRPEVELTPKLPPPATGALVPAKAANPLIEFSTVSREDPNEGVVFGDMSERCTCPHCEKIITTFIDYEASWVTWVLAFTVWFSLGWMAMWVLPLLWPAFKDVVHHCPRCLNVIARKSRIALPTFRTEVMSFKIGNCAVVLARKYVIIFLILASVIAGFACLRSTMHIENAPHFNKGPPSSLTWDDFIFDCGPRTSLRSRADTSRAFDRRYRGKTLKWQGEVRVIREGFEVLFMKTKSVLMMTMHPNRFPRRDAPDIALIFGEDLNKEVAVLNPGDWVEFEATMSAHGFRGDPEVMVMFHIKTVPAPSPLSSSAGAGRHIEDTEAGHNGTEVSHDSHEHDQETAAGGPQADQKAAVADSVPEPADVVDPVDMAPLAAVIDEAPTPEVAAVAAEGQGGAVEPSTAAASEQAPGSAA